MSKLENIICVVKMIRAREQTVEKLAAAIGAHENTVYKYVGALYESGLVDRRADMVSGAHRPGRRTFLYSWADGKDSA